MNRNDIQYYKDFDYAIELKNSNRLDESLVQFKELIYDKPNDYHNYLMIADIYWDKGMLDEAIIYANKALDLKPYSETVSLVVFHLYWDIGDHHCALEEMRRYTSYKYSEIYEEILNEL